MNLYQYITPILEACQTKREKSFLKETISKKEDCFKEYVKTPKITVAGPETAKAYIATLSKHERDVLGYIYWFRTRVPYLYFSHAACARYCRCSISTVQRCLNKLRDDGIISWQYRHNKTCLYTLTSILLHTTVALALRNVFPFLKCSVFLLLSFPVSEQIDRRLNIKEIYKKSYLRNEREMSMSAASKNTFLPKVGEYNRKVTPEDYASCGELDFFRQETYNPTPISKKVVSTGQSVAHDLSAYSSQERSDVIRAAQTQISKTPTKVKTRRSTISPHTLALRQQQPPKYGQGLTEHVVHKYFTYEAFLRSPEGKKAAQFISTNVFQREFDKYLQDTGSTYDQAFNLFLTME